VTRRHADIKVKLTYYVLPRSSGRRQRAHDGVVVTLKSNLRWSLTPAPSAAGTARRSRWRPVSICGRAGTVRHWNFSKEGNCQV